MDTACGMNWGEQKYIDSFGGEKRRRPLGRPKCRWQYNIKMNVNITGGCGMDYYG
jgi:hypothetical protein